MNLYDRRLHKSNLSLCRRLLFFIEIMQGCILDKHITLI